MMRIVVVTILFIATDCEILKILKLSRIRELDETLTHLPNNGIVTGSFGNNFSYISAGNTNDDLQYWKPDPNFTSKISTIKRQKNNAVDENMLPIFRHQNTNSSHKRQEGSSKWPKKLRQPPTVSKHHGKSNWPKLLRQPKKKLYHNKTATRITKMHMMQEGAETTTSVTSLKHSEEEPNEYLSSYSIRQQLEKIAKQIPFANVTVEVIGRTMEYQDIVLLKITKEKNESSKFFRADDEKYVDEMPEKKIIFIVHGLSVMGAKYLLCLSWEQELLTLISYYTAHLDKFDIFLIPMANPDGYTKLGLVEKYWNKNGAPQSECIGVALDRNFDVAWKTNRSINSCNQEYPGSEPFSEAETRAIRYIFHKYSHKIVAYLNVHAGTYDHNTFKGDAVLYPKGYTDSVADDDKYIDLKGEIDEVIRNASFQVFSVAVDSMYNWYGKVTGSSVDYASKVYGIPFALELVMQVYSDNNKPGSTGGYRESALTEVWSRVIDVIFKYIGKNLNKDEMQ